MGEKTLDSIGDSARNQQPQPIFRSQNLGADRVGSCHLFAKDFLPFSCFIFTIAENNRWRRRSPTCTLRTCHCRRKITLVLGIFCCLETGHYLYHESKKHESNNHQCQQTILSSLTALVRRNFPNRSARSRPIRTCRSNSTSQTPASIPNRTTSTTKICLTRCPALRAVPCNQCLHTTDPTPTRCNSGNTLTSAVHDSDTRHGRTTRGIAVPPCLAAPALVISRAGIETRRTGCARDRAEPIGC